MTEYKNKSIAPEKNSFIEIILAKITFYAIIFILLMIINITPFKKDVYNKINLELSRNISLREIESLLRKTTLASENFFNANFIDLYKNNNNLDTKDKEKEEDFSVDQDIINKINTEISDEDIKKNLIN